MPRGAEILPEFYFIAERSYSQAAYLPQMHCFENKVALGSPGRREDAGDGPEGRKRELRLNAEKKGGER